MVGENDGLEDKLIDLIMGVSYSEGKNTRMALTILYWNIKMDFIDKAYDVDHIFAKNLFKNIEKYNTNEVNPTAELDADSMANLQFLLASENKKKSDKFFDD